MKVAIYCRLSEEDRNKQSETDDSNSIQNQKSMLIQYSLNQGWEIYKIYSDDDYTGADRNRPEFCKLLQDAEDRKFDIVLCKTQSRFTRELEMVEKYIHGLFPLWGIRFISIVDNADTANKGNKKSRQINGLVNEWYLEDMSENIRSVLTSRRENGYHIGAFALYGYQKDPEVKGHLIIDEEAAQVVREVFTLFAQGYGKTAIARMLNDRGIPNPTEYKRLKGLRYQQPKTKNSTLWKYYAISDMLRNEMYIGNMVQGKYGSVSYKTKQNKPRPKEQWYRVEGTHEPIIDMELWNQVQALLEQKAKPFTVGTIGLFAKKAKCMYCGYTMRSCKNRGKYYLKCGTRHVAKEACVGSFISVSVLEQAVIRELNQLSEVYLNKEELEDKIVLNHDLSSKRTRLVTELARMKQKQEEYIRGLRELYIDKVKGIISEKDYIEMSKDFTMERDRLEEMIADIEHQMSEIDRKIQTGMNKQAIIEQYTNLEHLDRPTVEKLIDYILVGKRNPETKERPIEIHWNF
ncbi:MAG: recombinase family protein [Lachnospiraceae bacterium]|nr:recombinase family protein [Lachnospiraceae bacterium]